MTHWTPNIEKAKGDNLGATTQVTNVAESLIHLQIQHQSKLISLLATITQWKKLFLGSSKWSNLTTTFTSTTLVQVNTLFWLLSYKESNFLRSLVVRLGNGYDQVSVWYILFKKLYNEKKWCLKKLYFE